MLRPCGCYPVPTACPNAPPGAMCACTCHDSGGSHTLPVTRNDLPAIREAHAGATGRRGVVGVCGVGPVLASVPALCAEVEALRAVVAAVLASERARAHLAQKVDEHRGYHDTGMCYGDSHAMSREWIASATTALDAALVTLAAALRAAGYEVA